MSELQTKANKTKQKQVNINARVPIELRNRAKLYAHKHGRKLQHVVKCAIEDYITRIANPAR